MKPEIQLKSTVQKPTKAHMLKLFFYESGRLLLFFGQYDVWLWAYWNMWPCFFAAVATHGQAEHPGGLTPAVPVRQQVLRCGEQTPVYVYI